ncbi:unnamed protein product [Moneuplotes crassus]|uniref:CDP-alcohol phosphatidyltransferase n=1 Tax=Euplotes crassus TaxID=5936 RepID=A0AAD1XYY8_EUPCR|nr:unnamed protein product [Moneuplotes crassus]
MLDIFLRNVKDNFVAPFISLIQNYKFSPNYLTSIGGVFGIICTISASLGYTYASFALWMINRFFDGIDGAYARATKQTSDFGGYYDLVIDFSAYCFIPIGIVLNQRNEGVYIASLIMMSIIVLNNIGLFTLSAIIEKNDAAAKKYKHKEVTTLKMPPSIIEGAETMFFYSVFLIFPQYSVYTFSLFGFLVGVNIVHRLWWGYCNIKS